jgi:hypothetical protein
VDEMMKMGTQVTTRTWTRAVLGIMLLALAVMIGTAPSAAQGDPKLTLKVDRLLIRYPAWLASGLLVSDYVGDPPEQGPGFADAPHKRIEFYDPYPPEGVFDGKAVIQLYRSADLKRYLFLDEQRQQLTDLLNTKTDLKPFKIVDPTVAANTLPYLPALPHGQMLKARTQYVDTPGFRGITYVSVTRADVGPIMMNDVVYTFQGISADDTYYLSMSFYFSTTLFPAELPADFDLAKFSENFTEYVTESVDRLNAATSDQFRPSMDTLEAIVMSATLE